MLLTTLALALATYGLAAQQGKAELEKAEQGTPPAVSTISDLTRSSPFTTSSVGPSRLASTGVRVFVSARCTLTRSSGVFVLSGPPGRGA